MFRRLTSRRTLLIGLLVLDFLVLSLVLLSLSPHPSSPPPSVSSHPYFQYDLDANEPRSPPGLRCLLPKVHPFHPSIWEHFTVGKKIVCKSRRRGEFTYVGRDGVLRFNSSVVADTGYKVGDSLHCYWASVKRAGEKEDDDERVVYGKEFPLHEDGFLLPANVDVIQVHCQNFAGISVYEQLHAPIRTTLKFDSQKIHTSDSQKIRTSDSQKTSTPDSLKRILPKNRLNVLIFGLDSMSRLAFIRLLPRTYRYLTEHLNVTVFRGMNKIGDNTFPNLVALLTGKKAYGGGLPNDSNGFDDWPLIWRNFSSAGYATMWAEDFPKFGLFNYLAKGFRRPPTKHYLRPFWLAVEESSLLKFSSHMCYGSLPKHMLQINYVREFVSTYKDSGTPYFGFSFLAELSHEYLSRVASADEEFEDFFRFLHDDGHLKNTVLIVMSDHGHRFDAIRSTQVGHIEERMPFFALRAPSSITSAQPDIQSILSTNTGRLVTPFDIHATLVDLLNFATENTSTLGSSLPPTGTLGRSLFRTVPLERTCEDASIPPHFCICESESAIAHSDPRAVAAADATIRHINAMIADGGKDIAEKCSVLMLKLVQSASLVRSAENADVSGGGEKVRVVVEAEPSGGIFEATVMVGLKETRVLVDVSRINPYGEQSGCIRHVILRKYCYCRNVVDVEKPAMETTVS